MLSIVCPVYNEAENITGLLDSLATKVRVPFTLLVVYDRDEDTTLPVLASIMKRCRFTITPLKNAYGCGALNAVRTGLALAEGDAVVVVMADLSDDFAGIDQMYRMIIEQGYDVVAGSRYMRGGEQRGGPPLKKLLSRLAGMTLHYIAGIPTHDVTNNFKMYRTSFIRSTIIESRAGFEIGMELTVKAHAQGLRIAEIPTIWTDRTAGTSRFNLLKWIPHYLRWYRYALMRRAPRKTS